MRHTDEPALVRRARTRRKPIETQETGDLFDGEWAEVDPVLAGRECSRRAFHPLEIARRLRHSCCKDTRVPVSAGVTVLHRLVTLEVKAPVEIVRFHFVPVALAERIREATVDRARGVETDEIGA